MARSPNYPVMPLGDALNAIRPVLKAEHRNKMSQAVLAKHLGYGALSGRALGKIAAIRAYGLIEGSGDELRVSIDAITLLTAPDTESDKAATMMRCALRPTLFKDLNSDNDGDVSLDNLQYQIIQRGFTQDAARKAAENYLATMRLVSGNQGDYVSGAPPEESTKVRVEVQKPTPPPPPKPGMQRSEFPLAEGVARIEFPAEMSTESYEDLEAWAQLILRRAKRSVILS